MIVGAVAALTMNTAASAQPVARTSAVPSAEVRLPHISVVEMGRGDPVVLIPGLSSPRAVWDGLAPRLAPNHRVLLIQVNGFAGDDPGANSAAGATRGRSR